MKKTKVEKVVQFKSCNNKEVAAAVLSLAEPLLTACGDDEDMKKIILSLAVNGWNLALFSETVSEYQVKIDKKMPKNLSKEKRKIFEAFVLQVIEKKQSDFGGMMKGITEHSVSFNENVTSLELKTLPVNPNQV